MDTTTLNSLRATLHEGSQSNGSRKFVVGTHKVNYVFAKKSDAKEFKRFHDLATKWEIK